MARPQITIGTGVKVYEGPDYGRQDAVVVKVDQATIDVETIRSKRTLRGLIYWEELGDSPTPTRNYWTELPDGYVAGSEGH